MPAPLLTFLTDFADQAVILPLVATVLLVLVAQRRWRVAAAWLLAVPGVLGVLLVLKVTCYACGWLWPALGPDRLALRSPSGHAASAAVVYGGIALLLAARTRIGGVPASFPVALVVAAGMAALIGVTRVRLGAHSTSEVVVAACVGVAGAVIFARMAGRHIEQPSGLPVFAAALLVLFAFHGKHLPAEAVIQSTAVDVLRQWIAACRPS